MKKKIFSIICVFVLLAVIIQSNVAANTNISINDEDEFGASAISINSFGRKINVSISNLFNETLNYSINVIFLKPFGIFLLKNRMNRSLIETNINGTIAFNETISFELPVSVRFGFVFIIISLDNQMVVSYGPVFGKRAFFKGMTTADFGYDVLN